jgi:hypothetical protein
MVKYVNMSRLYSRILEYTVLLNKHNLLYCAIIATVQSRICDKKPI